MQGFIHSCVCLHGSIATPTSEPCFILLGFAEMFIPPGQETSSCGFSFSLIASFYLVLLHLCLI